MRSSPECESNFDFTTCPLLSLTKLAPPPALLPIGMSEPSGVPTPTVKIRTPAFAAAFAVLDAVTAASTTVSSILQRTAPCAWRAISPVSRVTWWLP